jgi:hypothetical protein
MVRRIVKYFLLYSLVLTAMSSCKKKELETNFEVISTPVNTKINKTHWLNKQVGFFCGGEKASTGYIYKTTDAGLTWLKQYNGEASLYDILFINDTVGYCCGENSLVLKTTNAGLTWNIFSKSTNSDDFFKGTLFGILNLNNRVWFFGGRNFNVGFVITTQGNVMRDGFKGFSNEFRCGIVKDTNTYIACGYGSAYKTSNNADSFTSLDFGNDYFTASSKITSSISFLSGHNGGVYKINSETNEAIQIFNPKKKLKKQARFNGIYFESETKGWVVGNDGLMLKTDDGKTFVVLDLKTSNTLLSVVSNKNNEIIVSTNDGKLIRIAQ